MVIFADGKLMGVEVDTDAPAWWVSPGEIRVAKPVRELGPPREDWWDEDRARKGNGWKVHRAHRQWARHPHRNV